MKILLVNDYATPSGGTELTVLRLRETLRQRGHQVRLFSSTARPNGQPSLADDSCFGTLTQVRGITQVWNPAARLRLAHLLREFRPDLVHIRLFLSQISPSILPLLKDIPTIYHTAWYRSVCPLGTRRLPDGSTCEHRCGRICVTTGCIPAYALPSMTVQQHLFRSSLPYINAVVANSHATRKRLEEGGIPVHQVIWNGVPDRGPRGELQDPPVVSFCARLVPEKGGRILLRAFAELKKRVPGAQLRIAGWGPEESVLKREAAQHGIQDAVLFLGHLSQEQMHKEFRNAWVHVVPSLWEEPFGLAAAEALMRATPVIVSNTGGLAEFVQQDRTGHLWSAGDPEELTELMFRTVASRLENLEMGRRAREYAVRYLDLELFADRFERLYQSLLHGGGREIEYRRTAGLQ